MLLGWMPRNLQTNRKIYDDFYEGFIVNCWWVAGIWIGCGPTPSNSHHQDEIICLILDPFIGHCYSEGVQPKVWTRFVDGTLFQSTPFLVIFRSPRAKAKASQLKQ